MNYYFTDTPCGRVKGTDCKAAGTVAYKGIRYATAERWKYPTEVTFWNGEYDATEYGHCSYQPRSFYDEDKNEKKYFYYNEFRKGETYTYSEDCLFLNIFAPEDARAGDGLPVLIYIHGGGFTGGCGHEKHFDSPIWAAKGIIGVTINYRLGPLGFAAMPELCEESGNTGNYGLYDQLCAIKWVRNNISAFGGDPEKITIMGQSAGAMSVQQLSLSPLSKGLFRGAVMSSGGGVNRLISAQPSERMFDFWHTVMKKAGCDSLEAFRALDVERLFALWRETQKELHKPGCFPCIDGEFVIGNGSDLLKRGMQHDIAYMAGATSEDMAAPFMQAMSKKWCEAQKKPAFVWHFDRHLPGDDNGAWHSSDLWYWFGTLDNGWRPWEEQDRELSGLMSDYLVNFVKSGSPNGEGLPKWESAQESHKAMTLGECTEMKNPSMLKLTWTMLTNKAVGE